MYEISSYMKTCFGSMYEISSHMKTFFGSMYEISSCYDRGFLIDEIMLYLIMYELFHDPYLCIRYVLRKLSMLFHIHDILNICLVEFKTKCFKES